MIYQEVCPTKVGYLLGAASFAPNLLCNPLYHDPFGIWMLPIFPSWYGLFFLPAPRGIMKLHQVLAHERSIRVTFCLSVQGFPRHGRARRPIKTIAHRRSIQPLTNSRSLKIFHFTNEHISADIGANERGRAWRIDTREMGPFK